MVRELSNYDPRAARIVLTWPLREALVSYEERMRREATLEHRHALTVWAPLAANSVKKMKQPEPPQILKGRHGK
jgi:hypothetical protein